MFRLIPDDSNYMVDKDELEKVFKMFLLAREIKSTFELEGFDWPRISPNQNHFENPPEGA